VFFFALMHSEESVIPTPSAGTFSPSDSYRLALVEDRSVEKNFFRDPHFYKNPNRSNRH
jgi:hypothetical protein